MIANGRRLGFLEEPYPAVRIPVVSRVDELEGHGATEPGVPASIHFAHAPATEGVADLGMLNDATGGGHTRSCAADASVVAMAGCQGRARDLNGVSGVSLLTELRLPVQAGGSLGGAEEWSLEFCRCLEV